MKIRFIYFNDQIMIVVGFTYDAQYDPPECFVAIPLKHAVTKSLLDINEIIVPISQAEEITDKNTINTILLLYGK